MVPDLERGTPLDLTHDAVRCRDTVMRCLKDSGDLVWNGNGEYEEICTNGKHLYRFDHISRTYIETKAREKYQGGRVLAVQC
jgi:hypothetical protein